MEYNNTRAIIHPASILNTAYFIARYIFRTLITRSRGRADRRNFVSTGSHLFCLLRIITLSSGRGSLHVTNFDKETLYYHSLASAIPAISFRSPSWELYKIGPLMEHNGNGGLQITKRSNGAVASAPGSTKASLDMKMEINRLETFSRWTLSFMDKNSLASAGFYYVGHNDVVRCSYCGIEVGCWEEGDDPIEEHRRWAPSCPFLRTIYNASNGGHSDIDPRKTGNDVCGLYKTEIRLNSGPENGTYTQQHLLKHLRINQNCGPSHPLYCSTNARMESFCVWPKFMKPLPEQLCEAGFFYTGKGDQTKCFHCGGGLKDWQPSDDPWIEHCKWFPQCPFVVLKKSKEFIQKAVALKQPVLSVEDIQNMSINERKEEEEKSSHDVGSVSPNDAKESSRESTSDAHLCKLCYEEELGVVFLPCGHLVSCVKCASAVSKCPVCRQPFTATVRTFLS